jgi:hypothetical protein
MSLEITPFSNLEDIELISNPNSEHYVELLPVK